jgi:hypothetical protein
MALIKVVNNDSVPDGAERDGRQVDCRCRRCRHKWMEIDGTKNTEGSGTLAMCPRCLASAIDRTRYYTTPNAGIHRAAEGRPVE